MKKYEKEILQNRLDSEEQLIKELEKLYEKVSKDCSKKIAALSARSDLENLQSIIYQEQYQQALKDEIDGLLNVLHSDEFKTISAYTTACYQDGFIGAMYSLHKQGIPLILPINQEAVIKAIQLDSKISDGLYNHLGESISEMKDNIRAEVSRGVTAGLTYNQISVNIAKGMNTPFTKAKFFATRIARTEGGRIANSSAMDACYKAKKRGCDIVKQWDSTLDGDTRPSHQKCDGEIRELDEKFSNGLMFPGDPSGAAGDVINCRCALLQRARIALDEEDLEELKERAAFFGLDKTENFEEFKQKYLKAAEEIASEIKYTPANSIEEAKEYLNNILGLDASYEYNNINLDCANMINQEITTAYNEFGNLHDLGVLDGVFVARGKKEYYAAYSPAAKQVVFNKSTLSKKTAIKAMKKDAKENFELGFWSTGDTTHAIRHELGHAVEHAFIHDDKDKVVEITALREQILNDCGISEWSVIDSEEHTLAAGKTLSYYALLSDSEFVAECVAEYMSGKPRTIAKTVVDLLIKE